MIVPRHRFFSSSVPGYAIPSAHRTARPEKKHLASHDPPWSLTAFVVASVARAAAHPEIHAYRSWRGQLVTHHYVDVATMVEISTARSLRHSARPARRRHPRSADLTAELRQVKRDPSASFSGRWLERAGQAVGMFADGAGFGITPMSLDVIVGGISQRLRVIDGQVTIRDVLDLTLAIDHNVVDGAPVARFGAEFRALLESAAVISPSN